MRVCRLTMAWALRSCRPARQGRPAAPCRCAPAPPCHAERRFQAGSASAARRAPRPSNCAATSGSFASIQRMRAVLAEPRAVSPLARSVCAAVFDARGGLGQRRLAVEGGGDLLVPDGLGGRDRSSEHRRCSRRATWSARPSASTMAVARARGCRRTLGTDRLHGQPDEDTPARAAGIVRQPRALLSAGAALRPAARRRARRA